MKPKENYGSRFLYSEDLLVGGEFKTVDLTISEFHEPGTMKSADGRLIDKPSIGFQGKQKLLVLCKTNSSVIHFATGEPPGNKWLGHRITLQPRMVEAFGDTVVALRVMPPKGCKIRKSILQRLGTKAEWTGTSNGHSPAPQSKLLSLTDALAARIRDLDTPDRADDIRCDIESSGLPESDQEKLHEQLAARCTELSEPFELGAK